MRYPVQVSTKIELTINLKTKAVGLNVPPGLSFNG
jgi:hypothetical protein